MKPYCLSVIAISVFATFFLGVSLIEEIHESINPEAHLSSFEYRKFIDFDYSVEHRSCDRETDVKCEVPRDSLDQDSLKELWANYRQYSLQSASRDVRRGIFNNSLSLSFVIVILLSHVFLLRRQSHATYKGPAKL